MRGTEVNAENMPLFRSSPALVLRIIIQAEFPRLLYCTAGAEVI